MSNNKTKFIPIIGLEVHIEQNTKRKMFCRCSADHFSKSANINTCPTCLGLPGAMPYPNKAAIENTVLFGLALGCSINKYSKFDRKHYFYPDLPKGYQITQYDLPFCKEGKWESTKNTIHRIRRVHLEEDTGKLQHKIIDGKKVSLIDYNRSGVPLMELVTEPDFHNSDDILNFLKDIQSLARYLKISNADMEKGSMRLEANISLYKTDKEINQINLKNINLPDYKVELKNINSFRFLKNAINAEVKRQSDLLLSGKKVAQETRGYDEKSETTYSQRTKENVKDYRYFPEPDIPSVYIDEKLMNSIQKKLVETPWSKRKRYVKKLRLSDEYAQILVNDYDRSIFFEELISLANKHKLNTKKLADLIINKNFDKKFTNPQELIIDVVKSQNSENASDEDTNKAVEEVLKNEAKAVEDYRKGKVNVVGFLLGMVQKKLSGKGDVATIRNLLTKQLEK